MARRRVPLAEFDLATNPEVQRALAVLTAARVLTADRGTVEVAHEALFREWPRLGTWIDEDQESRRVRAHLTEAANEWADSDRPTDQLYRGARLAAVLDWARDHDAEVNDLERQFVAASQAAREAEERQQRRANRRLRLLLAGASVALVLAIAAGVVATQQRAAAEQATTAADAQRLGAQALAAGTELDLSMLLARQAVALDDSVATQTNLASALDRSPAAISVWRPLGGDRGGLLGLSDDGSALLVGQGANGAVVDSATGKVRFRYDAQPNDTYIEITGDGRVLVVNRDPKTNEKSFKFLDGETGAPIGGFTFPPGWTITTNYSPDLKTAFGVSDDLRTLTAFDMATSEPVRVVHSPSGTSFIQVIGLPGGHFLTPLAKDGSDTAGSLAVWGPTGDGPLARFDFPDLGPIGWAFTPDLRLMAIDGMPGPGQVSIVDLTDSSLPVRAVLVTNDNFNEAFSPDGSLLVTGGDDGVTRVWDVASGDLLQTLVGQTASVIAIAVTEQDGQLTAWSTALDGTVIAYDLSGHRRVAQPFEAGNDFAGGIPNLARGPNVAFSPDERFVAVARLGGVSIFDASSHAPITQLSTADSNSEPALAWSGDGSRLAVTGIGAGIAELFDTATWKSVRGPLPGPLADRLPWPGKPGEQAEGSRVPNRARAVAFSPDSRTVAVGAEDGKLWTWNAVSGDPVGDPVQLEGPIFDLAYDPTTGALAAAVNPAMVKDSTPGIAVVMAPGESTPRFTVNVDDGYGRAGAVAFSPDGSVLVTGGGLGDVRFWDSRTGAEVGARVPAVTGWVLDLGWTPDGKSLVSSGTDGTVQLIDVEARAASGFMPGIDGGQWVDAAVSPDGKHVVAAYENGDALDWSISRADWLTDACRIAGRTLNPDEWAKYLPNRPYAPACTP